LSDGAYDRLIIWTLPRRVSKWLRRDLPKRVVAFGVPVDVVTAAEREHARELFADAERGGLPPAGLGGV
jgi:hypothetical protein